MIEILKC